MNQEPSFYKRFLKLYIALVLQNIITLSVNLTDNIMLGMYSETALSGVAAVNQIQFVYQMIILSFGEGIVIFGSQYWGKRQVEPIKRIAAIAMQCALAVGVLLTISVSIFPKHAVGLFTTNEPIIEEGARYLQVIRYTYLFFAVTQILLALLRSIKVVKIALWLSVVTFFVNCGINYVLIFGRFGMPRLGVTGAAIGTLIARITEVCILIFYIKCSREELKLKIRDFLKRDKLLWKDYRKVVAPMLLTNGLWGVNTALQTVILGHMTAAAIAANSSASNLYLLVKSTAIGAASASAVLVGETIGMGDMQEVRALSKKLQKMFLAIGICSGILLFFIRIPVLSLYNLSPETMSMANIFLIILCFADVGMSYQMPTNTGIIRAGGDTMYVVKLDIISIWCIVLPLSFVMAFIVKAPAAVVVCCLNADQVFKCIPAFIKVNYGNWIHNLTRKELG